MSIRVKAIRTGYYRGRRRPGDEFEIDRPDDKGRWMEILSGDGDQPPRGGDDEEPATQEQVVAAIQRLDQSNPDHYTQAGKPKIKAVRNLVDGKVDAEMVDEAFQAMYAGL